MSLPDMKNRVGPFPFVSWTQIDAPFAIIARDTAALKESFASSSTDDDNFPRNERDENVFCHVYRTHSREMGVSIKDAP